MCYEMGLSSFHKIAVLCAYFIIIYSKHTAVSISQQYFLEEVYQAVTLYTNTNKLTQTQNTQI